MTHPYADILRAVADGKTVQMRRKKHAEEWRTPENPLRFLGDSCADEYEFRVKPETIILAGHEFPEPVRKSLKYGAPYFMVSLRDAPYTEHRWRGYQHDHRGLKCGLIQLTAEGAVAQVKAMIAAIGGEV